MIPKKLKEHWLRTTAVAAVAAAFSLSAAPPAYAQDTVEEAEAETEDTIIVTGSLIRRPELSAPTPVVSVSTEEIEFSGATNIAEVLLELPQVGVPGISRNNSNFFVNASGQNTVDLRNLGDSRTLVLVNGRRFVAGVPGTSAVDLNAIPTDFIERLEVVTGGASAVYGSEAISGVVNIILKDDFEGVSLRGEFGETLLGDNTTYEFDGTVGGNFADGRGNAVLSVSYDDQGPVYSKDRERTAIDLISGFFFAGNEADALKAIVPFPSSFSLQGRFDVRGGTPSTTDDLTVDPDTDAVRKFLAATGQILTDSGEFLNPDGEIVDGFNRSQFRTIALPTTRYTLSGKADYDIFDNESVVVFLEGNYASAETFARLEPFPLAGNGLGSPYGAVQPEDVLAVSILAPDDPDDPDFVENFFSTNEFGTSSRTPQGIVTTDSGGIDASKTNFNLVLTPGMPINNPFIPQDMLDQALANGKLEQACTAESDIVTTPLQQGGENVYLFGDDEISQSEFDDLSDDDKAMAQQLFLQDCEDKVLVLPNGYQEIPFVRRLEEIAARTSDNLRQTFRFVMGAKGKIPGLNTWEYEVSYNYGRTTQSQLGTGQVNVNSFRFALDVEDDPNNPGGFRCVDPIARQQGCVPINIFGLGSISPEAAEYVEAPGNFDARQDQEVILARTSGELFDLPAGPLAMAVGYEYRKESARFANDALQQKGLNGGNAIEPTQGSFTVSEGFIEMGIPVLADLPFAHYWGVEGAVRFSGYSSVGQTVSYSLRSEFAPHPDVRFRAAYSEAVRAPNIGELFGGTGQTFPPGLQDPCSGVRSDGTGATNPDPDVGPNCLSEPALADRVAADEAAGLGGFTPTQPEIQGISGFTFSNPDLSEETATTLTAGVVLRPSFTPWLEPLAIAADYYRIEVDDVVFLTGRQTILDTCYTTPNLGTDLCDLITRTPNGALAFVNDILLNQASLFTEGVDIQLTYTFDFDGYGWKLPGASGIGLGSLDINAKYSYLMELSFESELGGFDDNTGEIGAPEHSYLIDMTYRNGPVSLAWQLEYIHESVFEAQPGLFGFNAPSIDSVYYNDVQVQYQLRDAVQLFAGVDNVFDIDPPFIPTSFPGNNTGTGTAAAVYDPIGRFVYGGVKVRF